MTGPAVRQPPLASLLRVVAGAGLLLTSLFAVYSLLYEWPAIGLLHLPSVIEGYPFGLEGPVAGNWRYARPERYGWAALVFGLWAVGCALLFWRSWRRRSWGALALAGVALLLSRPLEAVFELAWRAAGLP